MTELHNLTAEEILNRMLAYGKRVARRMMPKDHIEADSLAGASVRNALSAYDGRIPLHLWVAKCVRNTVWCYFRKAPRRGENRPEEYWEEVSISWVDSEDTIPQPDFQLLCEKYLEKWPLDVIARRHGVSIYRARLMIEEALERLMENRRVPLP